MLEEILLLMLQSMEGKHGQNMYTGVETASIIFIVKMKMNALLQEKQDVYFPQKTVERHGKYKMYMMVHCMR